MASNRKDGYEVTIVGQGRYYFTSYGSMIRFVDRVEIGQFNYRDGFLIFLDDRPTYELYGTSEEDLKHDGITFKEKVFAYGKKKIR